MAAVPGSVATSIAGQISPDIEASIPTAVAVGVPLLIVGIVWRLIKKFSRG